MQYFRQDPYTAHTKAVAALTAAGITPPVDWLALRDRFAAHVDAADSMVGRLTAAVLDGASDADLTALRAGALAETQATPQESATVTNVLRTAVVRRLRDLYAPHAEPNYLAVATLFDAQADKFTRAAAIVDPESDPADLITADVKTRTAWTDASLAAVELDRLVPVLQSAADLAGTSTDRPETLFALIADPGEVHRRTAWEAFNTSGGRCGRWAALLAAGITLRACNPLAALAPYRQPKPLEERWEPVTRGQYRRIVVDPEDQPAEAATAQI